MINNRLRGNASIAFSLYFEHSQIQASALPDF